MESIQRRAPRNLSPAYNVIHNTAPRQYNALWGIWTLGSKVVNFENLFLHGFWPKSERDILRWHPQIAKKKHSKYENFVFDDGEDIFDKLFNDAKDFFEIVFYDKNFIIE